jgi:hypothetical protein
VTRIRNELHAEQIEACKSNQGILSTAERNQLFMLAIQAVRRRALLTLSGITVGLVIERTLHECKQNFPILSDVTSEARGLEFDKVLHDVQILKSEKFQEALQELLISLLDVFGKITAEILTKYLHHELMRVNIDSLDPKRNHQLELVKTNREKK